VGCVLPHLTSDAAQHSSSLSEQNTIRAGIQTDFPYKPGMLAVLTKLKASLILTTITEIFSFNATGYERRDSDFKEQTI